VVIKIDKEHDEASFARLAVTPKDQRKGIGTAIVNWLEEFFKEKGVKSICIETYKKTPFLQEYYENMGYKVTRVLRIRGENILELKKSLT
ncbi:MAG: GNAT family N-acetyltransferase, partial [Candidatus Hodarchaeota archaeon]